MTTFDVTRIDSLLALSNNNLTVTHTNATANDSIAPGTTYHSSGQFSWTLTMGTVTAGHTQVGMCSATTVTSAGVFLQTSNGNSFGLAPNGHCMSFGGGVTIAGLAYANSAVIDFAVDLTNSLIWIRINGGSWNGSGTAVPGSSGGLTFITGALTPACNIYTQNDSAILNPVSSPALGFTSWDPPAPAIGQFDTITRHWRVTVTGVQQNTSSVVFQGKGYPVGTYTATGTLGVGGSAQWKGSNDGSTFVPVGTAITALPTQGILAAQDLGVFAYYRLDGTGGDGTTSFNATVDFSAQNMS